mmetsp:Transcript_56633/g.137574  ORF Transcript_56633/g.137574 Transcript_56633/m.137574 type:complete len:97 (-) Transcript_56633:461-751(-)
MFVPTDVFFQGTDHCILASFQNQHPSSDIHPSIHHHLRFDAPVGNSYILIKFPPRRNLNEPYAAAKILRIKIAIQFISVCLEAVNCARTTHSACKR